MTQEQAETEFCDNLGHTWSSEYGWSDDQRDAASGVKAIGGSFIRLNAKAITTQTGLDHDAQPVKSFFCGKTRIRSSKWLRVYTEEDDVPITTCGLTKAGRVPGGADWFKHTDY